MAGKIYLVKDGICDYTVVVPDEPSIVEEYAAKEITDYFFKTAKIHIKTVDECDAKDKCIYVGHTKFAEANGIKGESEENWKIAVIGESVVITGGLTNEMRGVSYAAYHFIEDCMGVRWWNEFEKYVPALSEFSLPSDFKAEGTPLFTERKAVSSFANYDFYPLARNRINLIANGENIIGKQFSRSAIETGGVKYVGAPSMMCHTMDRYFPPNEYYDIHPDWYGYNEAEQKHRPDFQMCFSNEGLFDNLVERMLRDMAKDKRIADRYKTNPPTVYVIGIGDHQNHCQCEKCKTSMKASGLSGHILKFTNRVAEAIGKVYPDVVIETSAYWDYIEAPLDDTMPLPNVRIRFADMLVDVAHGLNYPTNERKLRLMEKWSAICKKANVPMATWEYLFNDYPNFPMPVMYYLPENFKAYYEMGVRASFIEVGNGALSDFAVCNQWMMSKVLENPYLDFDKTLNDFLSKYYGESAAPFVREYLDMAHKECEESGMRILLFWTFSNHNYVSPKLLSDGLKLFGKAFEAVKGDSVLEQRLREAQLSIYRTIAIRYDDLQTIMKRTGDIYNLPSAKESAKKVLSCLDEIEEKYVYWFGVTSKHVDAFLIKNINRQRDVFNLIIEDEVKKVGVPAILDGVKEEDIYSIPAYRIIRFSKQRYQDVDIKADKESEYGKVLCYKGVNLDFTDALVDKYAWKLPVVLQQNLQREDAVEITKADLDGGGYKWFKIEGVTGVRRDSDINLYIKRHEDFILQISAITDVFPFDACDIYFSVKASGHSFGGDKDEEDTFSFDRFVIVRKGC